MGNIVPNHDDINKTFCSSTAFHLQVAVVLLSKHRASAGIKRTDTVAKSNLTRSAPHPLRYYFLLGGQSKSIA
jgi:hypothetical protein